nr:MAG TPA: hypothetical protein [Caudoviricetes sp.]
MARKVICAAALMFAAFSVWAQEQRLDSLFLNDGDIVPCKVTASSEVKYVYPGESLVNIVDMMQVKQVKLASGRIIKGQSVEPVLSEADWARVIVTSDENMARGLKFVKTIKAKSSIWRSVKGTESDKAYVELKKEAARYHCHLAVLIGGPTRSQNYWTGQNDVELRANIYTYPSAEHSVKSDWEAWRDSVVKNPRGSYDKTGYTRYRMIMDMIDGLTEDSSTNELAHDIAYKIGIYKQVCDSFLLNSVDGEQFALAYRKLKKALDKKMMNLNLSY